MKRLWLAAGILLAMQSCQSQPQNFKVEFKLDSIKEGTVIFFERKPPFENNPWIELPLKDGKCIYTGNFNHAIMAYFTVYPKNGQDGKGCSILIKNGKKIKVSEVKGESILKVENAPANADYEALVTKYKGLTDTAGECSRKESEFYQKYQQLYIQALENHAGEKGGYERFTASEKAGIEAGKKALDSITRLNGRVQQDLFDAIIQEPDFQNRDALAYMMFDLFTSDETHIRQTYPKWEGGHNADNPYILYMKDRFAYSEHDLIGTPAPDFEMPDLEGKTYKLSSMRGRNVLLVFSSTGCGWCKREVPFLRQVYENTKGKNFSIITIDLDTQRKYWERFVKDENVPWPVLCNLQEDNPVKKAYNISGVPATFLIDTEGNFLRIDLRGPELIDYVDRLYSR